MNEEKLEYYFSQMDAYLDGKLSKSDISEVEEAISQDPLLQSEMKRHVEARANIRIAAETKLKEKLLREFKNQSYNTQSSYAPKNETLSTHHKSIDPLPREKVNGFWKFIVLIGLVLFVLVSFYFFSRYDNKIKDKSLIAQYSDPNYDLLRTESESLDDTWTQATMTFMLKDYQKTLGLITGLEQDSAFMNANGGKFYLLKGVSLMRTDQQELAQGQLTSIEDDNPYYDQAQWYLALSYMQNKQSDKAKVILTHISNLEFHFRKKEASIILDGINE